MNKSWTDLDSRNATEGSSSNSDSTLMSSIELAKSVMAFATAFVGNNASRIDEIPAIYQAALDAALGVLGQLPPDGVHVGRPLSPLPVAPEGLGAARPREASSMAAEPQKPAVSPELSVHDDYIICLEDGRRMRTLKKHLAAKFGLTPTQYRIKWGLPPDYPMACPAYSRSRGLLAAQNKQKLSEARARARVRSS